MCDDKTKELVQNKNVQRNSFQLTINNPSNYGYTHKEIKKRFVDNFLTLEYLCMADEIGEKGTPHIHIFVCFESRVRFSTIKKHFPEAHIEPARGAVMHNIEYIKKSGKWIDTEKANTTVKGSFEEWGTPPKQRGKSNDMQELYSLIHDGYTNSEIIAINNDYILHLDKLDKLRTMLLTEKFKGTRRLDLKVIYISGATGTGKTRGVLDTHGDSAVYRVSDYKHPFDGYACQPVIAFDEFRSNLPLTDMLHYLDIYPIELPARFANKYACYTTAYIISNWRLEDQYSEVKIDHHESWKALLRRIHQVKHYNEDGTIESYNSVDEYMATRTPFDLRPFSATASLQSVRDVLSGKSNKIINS